MRFLQKAVMPARERAWLAAGDDLICGYVVDAADAVWADTASKLGHSHHCETCVRVHATSVTAIQGIGFIGHGTGS